MKGKEYNPGRELKRTLAFILFWLGIAIAASFLFTKCTTTKAVEKETDNVFISDAINVDSLVKAKVDSVSFHYEEMIREMNSIITFGENCNDDTLNAIINKLQLALNDSSQATHFLRLAMDDLSRIRKEPSKLIYNSDGSFEAIGLRIANTRLLESFKTADSLRRIAEQEKQVKANEVSQLKEEKSKTTVNKKTKFFTQWWFYLLVAAIAYIAGFIVAWKNKEKYMNESEFDRLPHKTKV